MLNNDKIYFGVIHFQEDAEEAHPGPIDLSQLYDKDNPKELR